MQSNSHVNQLFQNILNCFTDPTGQPETIPTDNGDSTVSEITDRLLYGSYEANRGYGLSHEQLVNLGIGNDQFKTAYEQSKK